MEEMVLEVFQTNTKDRLYEILHHKHQLLQIQHALGSQGFQQFISAFQMITVQNNDSIDLLTGNLYYFLTGGYFIKKIEKQKNIKTKAINGNRTTMTLPEVRHTSSLQPIQKGYMTKVQDLWSSDSKQIGTYKGNGNGKVDKILMISQSNLVVTISNKLRNYFLDKLKFINKLPLFQEIPRNVIQEKLQKFKLMKIFFNDLIYSQELRPTCMFILLKGEAVIETGKKSQGIIVKPPNILADQKLDQNEKGRCKTQFCICFAVQKVDVEGILKRKAEIDKRQFQGMSKTSTVGLLRANYFRNFQIKSEQQENKEQQQQQVGKNCIQSKIDSMMKKIRNKNKDILTSLSNKTVKKQRIRQHFSNFLNQRYKQYSSKLEKNLPKDREAPILYHIKSLSPSTPNYDQIQAKLREQRLKNILDPKQSTPRSNSSQYLLKCIQNAQSRKESFVLQNGCIRDKILKKLQYSIALQISKKYGGRMKLV